MRLLILLVTFLGLTANAKNIEIIKKQTTKGLEVLMIPAKKVPLVTICLAVRAGGMTERASTNGLTHLWEHMFFKGNKAIPSKEGFARRIRQLGISYNGDTSAEKVRYYFTLPSENLEDGLEFMSNAIAHPLLKTDELEKERIVVLDEYDRSESSPHFMYYNLNRVLRYGEKEYLRSPLGHRFLIEKATKKQLMQIKHEVMVPKNSSIIIGGDFEPSSALKLVEKHFKKWDNPKNWKPFQYEKPANIKSNHSYTMLNPLITEPSVRIAFNGPTTKDNPQDTYAADALISLLNHSSSKFNKKFITSGFALGAGLSYHTQKHSGELTVYGSTQPEKMKKLKKALYDEIKLWSNKNYFSQEILDDVKRQLIVNHKMETDVPSEFTLTFAFWWAVGGLDYYNSYIPNLQKITLEQVAAFAKKWFQNQPHHESIILSPSAAKKAGLSDTSKPLVKKHLQAFLFPKGKSPAKGAKK